MKNYMLYMLSLLLMLLSACTKTRYCTTCIRENAAGIIQDYRSYCNETAEITSGFEEGFRQRAIDSSETANCTWHTYN